MFKFCLLGLLLSASSVQAMEAGSLFTWDDRESGTGLHVSFQGKDKYDKPWTLQEAQEKNTSFYQGLFNDPEIVKTMWDGNRIELEKTETWVKSWIERFANGIPRGGLVIEQDQQPVGTLMVGEKGPGIAQFGRALKSSIQGQGIGTALLGFLVKEWAPAVRIIGLGQDINAPASAVDKFKCFGGEPLRLIYTTAHPSNVASWGPYTHFGFQPSQPTDATHTISCAGWEKPADKPLNIQYQSLETYIIDKHFSPTSLDPLQVDVHYPMLEDEDTPRTLSYVKNYESLRFHFEREVESVKQ